MALQTNWIDEASVSHELDQNIRSTLCRCFPKDAEHFAATRSWHGSVPDFSVWTEDDDGQVIGHVGVHHRTITVGEQSISVGGIMNVCIVPEYRGRDLLRSLMDQTADVMRSRELDGGLLFCSTVITKVYARLGWLLVEHRTVTRVDEHGVAVEMPPANAAMYLPMTLCELPAGPIHLQGNDW